jgi:hypothetical protein
VTQDPSDKTLAAEILEAVLATPGPHACYVVDRQGEELLLRFAHESPYGTAYVYYSPVGLVERLLEDCSDLLDRVSDLIIVRSVNGDPRNQKLSEKPLNKSDHQTVIKGFAQTATRFFIEGFIEKHAEAHGELIAEAALLAAAAMQAQIVKSLSDKGTADVELDVTWIKDGFDQFVNSMVEERQRFLKGSFESFFPSPDFSNLGSRYAPLLEIWQEAKKIYTRNRNHPSWQSTIRNLHPTLPDDLIERLGRQGDSAPSGIAIEQAARLCGAQRNQFSVRHYFRLMNNGNSDAITEVRDVTD